jgi:hypothetical protein
MCEKVRKNGGCGRFDQNNGGVDLESNCDWLDARLEEALRGKEHHEVGFPTSPILWWGVQLWGSYGICAKTTYCWKWFGSVVIKPYGEDKQFEVSFLESLISPSSDKGWRSGGQISEGMFIVVTIFERIWRVNFDQPYLPIGDNKKL